MEIDAIIIQIDKSMNKFALKKQKYRDFSGNII